MKKIVAIISVFVMSIVFLSAKSSSNFKYKYEIVANSNSMNDMLELYKVKEYMLQKYNTLVLNLNETFHEKAVIDNISFFIKSDLGTAIYQNGIIKITIGDGNGSLIEGDLKRSYCDDEPVNYKVYIFDLLFGK